MEKLKGLTKKWWFWAIAAVLVIGIGGSASESNKQTAQPTTQPQSTAVSTNKPTKTAAPKPVQTAKPDLEVISSKLEKGTYLSYITGKIRNNTDRQFNYVQVEINLYDKNGDQADSTLTNTANLEPHSTWKFKALVANSDEVKSFKIKEVSHN